MDKISSHFIRFLHIRKLDDCGIPIRIPMHSGKHIRWLWNSSRISIIVPVGNATLANPSNQMWTNLFILTLYQYPQIFRPSAAPEEHVTKLNPNCLKNDLKICLLLSLLFSFVIKTTPTKYIFLPELNLKEVLLDE